MSGVVPVGVDACTPSDILNYTSIDKREAETKYWAIMYQGTNNEPWQIPVDFLETSQEFKFNFNWADMTAYTWQLTRCDGWMSDFLRRRRRTEPGRRLEEWFY